MSQTTQHGKAEIDTWIKVDRANGAVEYYHVVNEENVTITAAEYAAAHEEKECADG